MTAGDNKAEPFWTAFLRSRRHRSRRDVKLVVSDRPEAVDHHQQGQDYARPTGRDSSYGFKLVELIAKGTTASAGRHVVRPGGTPPPQDPN